MFNRLIFILFFIFTISVSAQDFQYISGGLAFMEFKNAKNGLGAIIKMEDKFYIVTTQSLFVKYGSEFVFKDFIGNQLECSNMSVCRDLDLVRFEIKENDFFQPFELGGNPYSIFHMEPDSGTVSRTKFSEKGIIESPSEDVAPEEQKQEKDEPKDAKAKAEKGEDEDAKTKKKHVEKSFVEPGSLVVSGEGLLCGFESITEGFSDKKEADFVKLSKEIKWQESTIRSFGSQIDELWDMKSKLISIEGLKKAHRMNAYVEYLPHYDDSHYSWVEERNVQYEKSVFDSKGGKSSGAAKFRHNSRCNYYSGMKRLSIYAKNLIMVSDKTKWQSEFLKGLSKDLSERADKLNKQLNKEMKQLVKKYPATKIKL